MVRGYMDSRGLSFNELELLDLARKKLIHSRNQELLRLSLLEELSLNNQRASARDPIQGKTLGVKQILDLFSKHFPVDRLHRLLWQVAYPEETLLRSEDMAAFISLFEEAQWPEGSVEIRSALSDSACVIELFKTSSAR